MNEKCRKEQQQNYARLLFVCLSVSGEVYSLLFVSWFMNKCKSSSIESYAHLRYTGSYTY